MNKNETYIFEKSPELYTAIKNRNLWFVRSVMIPMDLHSSLAKHGKEEYVNMDDVFDYTNILSIPERPMFNQSINTLVLPFTALNVWDCRPYIFVAPMNEYIGELVGGTQQDYLTIGSHTYSDESYLLVPNKELGAITKLLKPKLQSTIIGYNYPNDIRGHEGISCLKSLKQLLSKGYETPRMAVEKLFDKISAEKGYDIWRLNKELQFVDNTNEPRVHPSTAEINNNSWRIKNNGSGESVNVDRILNSFNPLFEADSLSIEVLSKYIHDKVKSVLIIPKNTEDSHTFLYDYISEINPNEEFKENECPKLGKYELITLKGFNLLSDYENQLASVSKNGIKYNDFSIKYLTTIYNKSIQLLLLLEIIHMFKVKYITDTSAIQKLDKLINSKIFKTNKFSVILHDLYTEKKDAIDTITKLTSIISDICYLYEEPDEEIVDTFNVGIKLYKDMLDSAVKKLQSVFSIRKKSLASNSFANNSVMSNKPAKKKSRQVRGIVKSLSNTKKNNKNKKIDKKKKTRKAYSI